MIFRPLEQTGIRIFCIGLIMLMAGLAKPVRAQVKSTDSAAVSPAYQSAVSLYTASMLHQEQVLSGVQYVEFNSRMKGHPYYLSDSWEEGSVWYEGHGYNKIPMMYDIARDELVIEHFDQNGFGVMLKPYPDKITKFVLLGHVFVRIDGDTINNVKPGYYEVLYNGKVAVVAKRKKNYADEVSLSESYRIYTTKDRYYLVRDGKFLVLTNKKSVINATIDQKTLIRQFINQHGLTFEDKDKDFVSVATYYDSIRP